MQKFSCFGKPAIRNSFVELSTLNLAPLERQPKFCKNPTFIFLLYFIFFWLNFANFGILVFSFFVGCVYYAFWVPKRVIQKDKDGVDLFGNEFLGVD